MNATSSPTVAEIREARRARQQTEAAAGPHYVFACQVCGREVLSKRDPGLGAFDSPRNHRAECCNTRAEFVRDGGPEN